METGFMLFSVFFYSNIKIAGQWGYLLHLRKVISFPRFSDGVFSKIQWGWGPPDEVSVKRMGFQWGWLKVNGVALKVNEVDFQWGCYRG